MRNQAPLFIAAVIGSVFLSGSAKAQVAGFTDVPAKHWAAESVEKLVSMGILQGPPAKSGTRTAKSNFDGNKPVTRYELAKTLYLFVQALDRSEAQKKSKMGADISGPEAVKYLSSNGYLPKDSVLFKEGTKLVTANQLADTLYLVVAKIKEKRIPLTPGSKNAPD